MHPNTKDLTGCKIGKLTVLKDGGRSSSGGMMWLCECDCGSRVVVAATNLISGRQKACGCVRSESTSKRKTTHGQHVTPEYKCWSKLKERCRNPNAKDYPRYGGRGIAVCDRWNSFENFSLDMGKRPSSRHSIDRIDNSLGYYPDNCRWATSLEQGQNKRNNINLTIHGETKTVAEWSRISGVRAATIYFRIHNGMNAEEAVKRIPGKKETKP